jgi:toxin-antitoxin system PIN domain toxin
VKISLPDVNILLALVAAGHTHHANALEWFEAQENDSVAICRVTQMGLLRLLTNPKVLSGHCSIQRAFEISNELLADRRVFFEYEPPELETAWAALMQHPAAKASSWTDAYLAAFAQKHDYSMATFDRDFKRWADLKLSLLDQPAL